MSAIWYLHWIELRWRILIGVAFALAFAIIFGMKIQDGLAFLARTGSLGGPYTRDSAAMQYLGSEGMVVWAHVLDVVSNVMLILPMLLGLSQSRSPEIRTTRPMLLALPFSRTRFVQTRFLANSAVMLATLLLAATFAGTWLRLQHYSVPWPTVFFSTVIAWVLRIPVLAAADALNASIEPSKTAAAVYAILFIPYFGIHLWFLLVVVHATANPAYLTPFLWGAALCSVAFVGLSDYIERHKEY